MGAEGPPRGRPQAHHRLLPPSPLYSTLTVVVACHNEAENLVRYPHELFPILDALDIGCEVVIVDDGSTDATADQAATFAMSDKRVRLIRLSANRGLGGALRAGFSAARGEWIAALDADLTFSPAAVKDLLDTALKSGTDLVAGSPYLRPDDMAGVPWARRLPSLLMNALYRGLFGLRLTAYTPVLRLYRASRLRTLALTSEGFEINAEIAARALLAGWPVAEVPVPLLARTAGVSKLRRLRELRGHLILITRLLCGR